MKTIIVLALASQLSPDFDTAPGKDISAKLDRLRKSHLLKIYPAIGEISDDGHDLLYLASPNGNLMFFNFWTTTSDTDSIRVRVLRGPE